MESIKIHKLIRKRLADSVTPVSVYLKIRKEFGKALLLESADYHGQKGSFSFICFEPVAGFVVEDGVITESLPAAEPVQSLVANGENVPARLDAFLRRFEPVGGTEFDKVDGLFGYSTYNAERYFERIEIGMKTKAAHKIPELQYHFFKYIIAIDHFRGELYIQENLFANEVGNVEEIDALLNHIVFDISGFGLVGPEASNVTDSQFMDMVSRGKHHCRVGDVFQIVLSRQFRQNFVGDDFNVYRALRHINPSPYLFYFDYGTFRIFGSSPEAQLQVEAGKATINPIAGTFRRTGNDKSDKKLAEQLAADPKENAEHVMLVDLARNDLSRNCAGVVVETYKEIQYFSHVLHMVSQVSGQLHAESNPVRVYADTFPAGTLSGAPKYRAMSLIEEIENQDRSYYGGAIGFLGFNGDLNHAITIRSFLSKDNTLYYQAGAGVVDKSVEENELQEVNNKLAALKRALELAIKF
ncbi:MAG: hypothetical protein RIS47_1338 [Bacteroidota bacterium]|jgi:anthranilate synthase component 1